MEKPPEIFESSYHDESIQSGLIRFIKEKPMGVLGLSGMVGACSYAYWRYKTKGYSISPSVFLVQLRVGAQACVIGSLTLGMLYNMIQTHVIKKPKNDSN